MSGAYVVYNLSVLTELFLLLNNQFCKRRRLLLPFNDLLFCSLIYIFRGAKMFHFITTLVMKKTKNRFASIVKHCSQVKSLKTPPPTTVKLPCLTRLLHYLLQTLRVMFYKQNGGFTCLLVGKTVNKRFEIQWGGGRLKSFANKKSKVSGNEQYNGR